MRIITILVGILFILGGAVLICFQGLTFMAVAFLIGIGFVVAGIVEVLSYRSYRGDNEDKGWVLIDGLTTFALGCLILSSMIAADNVVTMVFGLWVLTGGIRNLVRAWEHRTDRHRFFYDHLIVGIINTLTGLYVFLDQQFFNLPALVLIGICVIVQGLNIYHVGTSIIIIKPDFIKTKEEKLQEAAMRAEEAHQAAKAAIKAAKEAQKELKVVIATPDEQLDVTLAPKPEAERAVSE